MNDEALLAMCGEVVDSVKQALDQVTDWGLPEAARTVRDRSGGRLGGS